MKLFPIVRSVLTTAAVLLFLALDVEFGLAQTQVYGGNVVLINNQSTYWYKEGTTSRRYLIPALQMQIIPPPPGPFTQTDSLQIATFTPLENQSGGVFPITSFTEHSSFAIVFACVPGISSPPALSFEDADGAILWGLGCDSDSSLAITSRVPGAGSTKASSYRLWDSNMSPSQDLRDSEKRVALIAVGSLQADAKLRLDIFGIIDGRWIGSLNDAGWPVQVVTDKNGQSVYPYFPAKIDIGMAPLNQVPTLRNWFSSVKVWDAPLMQSVISTPANPKVNVMTPALRSLLDEVLFTKLQSPSDKYVPCNSGHWLPEVAAKGNLGPVPVPRDVHRLCGEPPPLSGYVKCADEGQACSQPGLVQYGAFEEGKNGVLVPHFMSGQVIQPLVCNNDTFHHDPWDNHPKACYVWLGPSDSTTNPPSVNLPYQWIPCGKDSSGVSPTCAVPEDAGPQIAYGALGSFTYKAVSPGSKVACFKDVDPAVLVVKTCFYQRKLKVTN